MIRAVDLQLQRAARETAEQITPLKPDNNSSALRRNLLVVGR